MCAREHTHTHTHIQKNQSTRRRGHSTFRKLEAGQGRFQPGGRARGGDRGTLVAPPGCEHRAPLAAVPGASLFGELGSGGEGPGPSLQPQGHPDNFQAPSHRPSVTCFFILRRFVKICVDFILRPFSSLGLLARGSCQCLHHAFYKSCGPASGPLNIST